MSVQHADDVTLHDLLIRHSQDQSFKLRPAGVQSQPPALKTETYKDSVMEANRASDTFLAHADRHPFALTLGYTAVHRLTVGPGGITAGGGGSTAAARPNKTRSP